MRLSEYASTNGLAEFHKALGDETRLRVVYLLLRVGELCVCDVERALEVTQSKASRHLNYLKRAGVVTDRRDGQWVYYRLAKGDATPLRSAIWAIGTTLDQDPVAQAALARVRDASHCKPAMSPAPSRK